MADVLSDGHLDGDITAYLLAVTVAVYGPELLLALGEVLRKRRDGS